MKVSALVSLYKAGEFIDGCLADLTSQSLFHAGLLEIVVIDSASPDGERSVVEEYQRRFSAIKYIRTEEREKLYQAWNRGIAAAQGEYITNANADDRHHPECLEILSRVLDAQSNIQLAYGDVVESRVANQPFYETPKASRYCYHTYFAPDALLYYQFGCQPVWRKEIHRSLGYFSDSMAAAGDWEFNLRFALAGLRAVHVSMVLGSFLNRPTSISTQDDTSTREQHELRERYMRLETILTLYQREGWQVAAPQEKAAAFTDFARRATNLHLPWEPGKHFVDAHAALLCCAQAFELTRDDPRVAWNLGVALLKAARHEEAQQYLQLAAGAKDPAIDRILASVQQGVGSDLAMVSLA